MISTERRQDTSRREEEALGAASRAATTGEDRASGMRIEGTKGRRSKASLALGSSHLYRRQVIRQVFGGRKDPSALRELRGRRRGSTGWAVVRRRESPKAIEGGFEVSARARRHGRVRACWRNQRADAEWSARGERADAEKRGERRRVSDESQEPGSNLETGRRPQLKPYAFRAPHHMTALLLDLEGCAAEKRLHVLIQARCAGWRAPSSQGSCTSREQHEGLEPDVGS